MDEKDFEMLTILDQTRNITKTANILFMTQSALSKRICSLEKELGVPLIIRSRRGIQLTPEGELALQYTRQASNSLQHLRDTLLSRHGQINGTLHLGACTSYLNYEMADVLAGYHRLYPNVNINIDNGRSRHLCQKLMAGTLDLAIVRGEYSYKGNKKLLKEDCLYFACNQELADRPLSELTFIGNRPEITFGGDLARWLYENDIHVQNNHIFSEEFSVGIELVRQGIGWSVFPGFMLKDYQGCIRPLCHPDGTPYVHATWLFYSDSAVKLPQSKAFIDFLGSLYG